MQVPKSLEDVEKVEVAAERTLPPLRYYEAASPVGTPGKTYRAIPSLCGAHFEDAYLRSLRAARGFHQRPGA